MCFLSLPGLQVPALTKGVSQTNNISITTKMTMAIYFINDNDININDNDNDINTNDNDKTDSLLLDFITADNFISYSLSD